MAKTSGPDAKFCVDCVNFREGMLVHMLRGPHGCGSDKASVRNLVTGEEETLSCGEMRVWGLCGTEGKLFEAKMADKAAPAAADTALSEAC